MDVDGSVVPATEIIDMVSRLGISDVFHVWLIDTTFKQLYQWQQQRNDLRVNLSVLGHQCQDALLVSCLSDTFERYDIESSRLQLQLAENTLLVHPVATTKMINALHERGVLVSINNFGSDYSSIGHLATLPIDSLCIDPRLFEDIHTNKRKRLFVEALIAMGL